ncbi:hypothetical protein P3X46_027365 [Hevea brasiliensis]|uniref:Uncharacterized protein n=1 Tax=Hevea brasiliensis TaxID=3981 RepID=A0ABQ9KZM0_HEVBR|nr:uncharacterized protein LOC110671637 isoform X2 [Hevea brasiliensis]XP_057993335.1 uncharacterized protein LOC110671637 isoform X2 [Hevea brasiliensis]XP_057993336.1 uncharacterized protein LOC110671637 isoform X2 [Hevea brasiliensis]XP_057993337.1 uncharacterized protein LOC110671637 isoform X2 [Hevea brasiliensis]KAJ9153983.1 hypothetical protein P3X46_027365 [Hevea brasiliensis]KAJ9153984.1 hypothetical protein P3X46_027365 [Hevea brasiliensis]
MSRCFPFPPPGYEKVMRDDVDLLKKEKDREKKHKKEKKNKEKREGKDKEKREKDRSDGKLRDKKEKKDKHRGKKERDRDKDKDKISAPDAKRLPGQSERNIGDKTPDEKKISGKSEINSGEIFIQKGKERDLDRKSISDEKKFAGQFSGYSERASQNSHLTEQPKESNFVHEVSRRTRDEVGGIGKQLVENIISADARKDERMVRFVANTTGTLADSKEKNKRGDEQGIRDESRFSGKAIASILPGTVQTKIDKTPIRLEKDFEKRIEGKETNKQKEGDDRHGDKQKDKDKGKGGQGKDKEKKKEEKAKKKNEHKIPELDKLKENNKVDHTAIHNAKASHLPKENTKSGVTEGNPRKRKDSDTNGFFNANDIKPSKMPRPTSSHPLMENGKILETPQTSIPLISDRHRAVNNLKVDGKECKINGVIEAQASSIASATQPLSIPTAKSLLTTAQADQIAKVFRKQPHPDTKYLTEVLTVPKIEEWCDFDDQEWLFQGRDSQSKKPKMGSFGVDEAPHVWSEALQIESADVCALPYVIPY